ncbi:MAG: SpaA isopeptide-forming pilin-related protein [Anaerorhabdus sp.]
MIKNKISIALLTLSLLLSGIIAYADDTTSNESKEEIVEDSEIKEEELPIVTEEPITSELPVPTDTPIDTVVPTDKPIETELPVDTSIPTEKPVVTDEPITTELPVPTTLPTETPIVTETPIIDESLPLIDLEESKPIESEVPTYNLDELNDEYWTNAKELMSVEDFSSYYNGEQNDLLRAELVRVRTLATYTANGISGTRYISIMSINGETVFCLNPRILAGIGQEYSESYDWLKLDWDTKNTIWHVTRFGYQKHRTDNYYIATQILIWQALGVYATPSINVDSEIAQIKYDMNNFHERPNFNTSGLELDYQVPTTITDSNGVLKDFNVSCPSGISCSKNGNDLTVTIDDINYDKKGKITMKTNGNDNPDWIGMVWVLEGSQSVATIRHSDPISRFDLNVKMISGDAKIIKLDEYYEKTFKGNKFMIARDEQFTDVIGEYTTNDKGEIFLDDYLPPNTYYLKEVSVVEPYLLNENVFTFTVVKNELVEIEVINALRQVDLRLFKKDEEENELLLNGAIFSVSDTAFSEEVQKVNEDGELMWELDDTGEQVLDEDGNPIPIMERVGQIEFEVVSGNQYIRLFDEIDNTIPYNGEVEFSYTNDFLEVAKTTSTDEKGLIKINELNFKFEPTEDEEVTNKIYYRKKADDTVHEIEVLNKEELQGYSNLPLKFGRVYEVCEVQPPVGYEMPKEPCKEVDLTVDEGVDFVMQDLFNKLRRLNLKLLKQTKEA